MGAVNYGTSDYITMAYNCNTEYAPDDFWNDENEQREFEISFLHDEVKAELEKHSFYYYHIAIKPGYYEGFYIDIENNFPVALDSWQDRRDANKEITEIKRFLIECAGLGLVECFPGWCTGYSSYTETLQAIKTAIKAMRDELKSIPTVAQYEKGGVIMKTIHQSIQDAMKAAEEWRKANGKEPQKPVVYGAWNTPRI